MAIKNITAAFRIAFIFAGALIGAGFASGQELLQFFITYGSLGFGGIFCAGLFFSLLSWRLLTISRRFKLTSFSDLARLLCGRKTALFFEYAVFFFLFAVFAIMIAGAGSAAERLLALPARQCAIFFTFLVLLASTKGFSGVAKINAFLTPFLAAIILTVSLSSLSYHHFSLESIRQAAAYSNQPAPHWLLACISYAAYNMILASAILVPLGGKTAVPSGKPVFICASLLGGAILAVLSFLIVCTLLAHSPAILAEPFPMLTISCTQNKLHAILYILVLASAMFTTSLSCLYACADKVSSLLPAGKFACAFLIAALALCFSKIGFSQLIAVLFPFFGYVSSWLFLKLMLKPLKK